MALPKRKISKSRKAKRRTHWKAAAPQLSVCDHCGQPKLPHRVCPNCGYYAGREIFVPEEKK